MVKKSKAQISRMLKRAASRGVTYVPPAPESDCPAIHDGESTLADAKDKKRLTIAGKLRAALEAIDKDEGIKAKERRSAKRKAEAIAAEEAGCSVEELLEWYDGQSPPPPPLEEPVSNGESRDEHDEPLTEKSVGKSNPYIVFVGQLSFTTTRDMLFQHIKNEIGKEHTVTGETVSIRLLTDSKTKKSRGMAFVETTDPDLLYACLKMHHTQLDGRRINVERTAGGKRNSDARKTKLTELRKEQQGYISDIIDKMMADHISAGELQEKELDDGVIALCKRHSAATVEASLVEYMETNGREKDNPSAYLTFIIGKIAEEGLEEQKVKKEMRERRSSERQGDDGPKKRPRLNKDAPSKLGTMGNKLGRESTFSKNGVDMSISHSSESQPMLKIFPSMSRGRGRGRGYM